MDILWDSPIEMSASEIRETSNEELSIYTIQQALRHLLEIRFIEVYDIAFNNKSLTRKYKPLVSQAEYVDSFINNDTRLQLASNFVNNTDEFRRIRKASKTHREKIKSIKMTFSLTSFFSGLCSVTLFIMCLQLYYDIKRHINTFVQMHSY